MYEQIREDALFVIIYSAVTAMAMMASCYLLFRRGNAFAPDVTPPARLRRWTGVFFAFLALNHVWYMPFLFLTSSEDIRMVDYVGGMLDSVTVFPLSVVVLFAMLQDRRRPLWPIALMMAPITLGTVVCVVTRSNALYPVMYGYVLLLGIGLTIYMARAIRQYGRWLRDNYADLEHKEVWQSFTVLAIVLLVFVIYEFCYEGMAYLYAMLVICVVLICFLLWRVETLSDLSMPGNDAEEAGDGPFLPTESNALSSMALCNSIEPLLKQHCEEAQLYLQHDISAIHLAKLIGTNRTYLSKYFALKGITYNAYINGLRIQHFMRLYHETIANRQPMKTKQLASLSGFHSYSTFNAAFKQSMGMTATEWMHNIAGQDSSDI